MYIWKLNAQFNSDWRLGKFSKEHGKRRGEVATLISNWEAAIHRLAKEGKGKTIEEAVQFALPKPLRHTKATCVPQFFDSQFRCFEHELVILGNL